MLVNLRRAVVVSIVLFLLCGLAYAGVSTGVDQVLFPHAANGSLVISGRTVVGSSLVGQQWTGPRWFQGRPDSDNPMASGAQNFGPSSAALKTFSHDELVRLRHQRIVPTNDLVTGSGSGIDPDISPSDAYAQVSAVARATGLSVGAVRGLVAQHVSGAEWGFLGAPTVNVLELNLALAALVRQ